MITHESKDYQNDHIMKDFWRNNERITSLFKGKAVIKPENIERTDTELATIKHGQKKRCIKEDYEF